MSDAARLKTIAEDAAHQQELDIANLRHIKPRHYGRMIAAAIILLLAALLVRAFAEGQIGWAVVGQYIFWPTIMMGVVNTVWLSVASMAIGVILGGLCAVARSSPNAVLRTVALFYTWFFRGTPIILQLLVWYNLALVFPHIGIKGIWYAKTVHVMTPAAAALLGLGLNEGAYISEIMRAGLLAVDVGQYEACKAIGMPRLMMLRRIIMPQALRVAIPPLGNEFIGLVKTSSLASIVGFTDLLKASENVYYVNTAVMELLLVAGLWYLVVVTVLSVFQRSLEQRASRGFARAAR
ncbi:amino acid ABC transporter permease [Acidisoma silvae]|uniref:Glutamate/aspartate import permease protein GltK n=1 Tax=Acidisoma silvae TaxID=2802396 RepID=A0A963YVD8_9PROT|nr:amino acid ABC transporter permease [Acidisoma silvae]MCB8877541.1 amino acid ABC transporter permease [Acidisoma silvae]